MTYAVRWDDFAEIVWGKRVQCNACTLTYRTKRQRKYCSPACKQRAYRARKKAEKHE